MGGRIPNVTQDMWDERYSGADRVWSGDPNPWLVEMAATLRPGSALDLGCGEGADAVWLADAGWDVTAMDFSAAGLARGAEKAQERGVQVEWVLADLAQWTPQRRWDLVSVQFMHGDPSLREHVHNAAWAATAGTLVIVGHDDSHPGPPPAEVRYGVPEILAAIGLRPDSPQVAIAELRRRGDSVDAIVIARRHV